MEDISVFQLELNYSHWFNPSFFMENAKQKAANA